MRTHDFQATLKATVLGVTVLLLVTGVSSAQTVNLTAAPAFANLPDGQSVPMWGYSCNGTGTGGASCAALNPAGGWSPIVITVAPGPLTINLTNGLPSPVPTSLTIIGAFGGGMGNPNIMPSPAHATYGATWSTVTDTSKSAFTPPTQPGRVQSFGTEVANGAIAIGLTWNNLAPGTYLIESGTHPSIQAPMGLYGVLVVTTAPTTGTRGTAYPSVPYDGDAVNLLSEIDPVQNMAVVAAVGTSGFKETSARILRDNVTAVNIASGGSGYSVNDVVVISGGGFSVQATATVAAVDGTNGNAITAVTVSNPGKGYSSIPTASVTPSVGTGAKLVVALSLTGDMCSDSAAACYPPVVNYSPLYYMINGIAFDKTNPSNSSVAVGTLLNPVSGQVLVRFVNAGLHMHVPSIVGSQTTGTSGVVNGFSLIAEDANLLPEVALAATKSNPLGARIQSEVFMAAGKTYDVMINVPASGTAFPVFDRQLSLSTNNARDGGMRSYVNVNGGALPTAASAAANPDSYFIAPGKTLTVSDPGKGVIANDVNIYGVRATVPPTHAAPNGFTLSPDGTFSYTPVATCTTGCTDSFTYCGNGSSLPSASCALVSLNAAPLEAGSGIHVVADTFTSNVATTLTISPPGVLANDYDDAGYPLTVDTTTIVTPIGSPLTLTVNPDGSFNAKSALSGQFTFTYLAKNSQGTQSPAASPATVTLNFPTPSNLAVHVWDAPTYAAGTSPVELHDYRWIIEEDRTFFIDPKCQQNPLPSGCPGKTVPSLGTNFHTSYMPVIAAGCVSGGSAVACESGQSVIDPNTGNHNPAVCDLGNGVCRTTAAQQAPLDPAEVYLDPAKRYYISVLPGDAGNAFANGGGGAVTVGSQKRQFDIKLDCPSGPGGADFAAGTGKCGHSIGGAQIAAGQPGTAPVNVLLQQTPLPPAKLAVFVFQDDSPLNGEQDVHGGLAADPLGTSSEQGLGNFQIRMWDDAGASGDATGQMTYDMFNMPLSNSLQGTIDPLTGLNACPISTNGNDGIVGMIITCPRYESDGKTLSPLVGQAVVTNLMPGRYGVQADPGADRIAHGEEWLQTNTLDGQKAHDSFLRIGEPAYFQEFGPAGYHVAIGFANPKTINSRLADLCAKTTGGCLNSVSGKITSLHISRPPNENLYDSNDRSSLSFTQCYVSVGDTDGDDFGFTKCNSDGTFKISGLPDGNLRITVFDQWNDQIVDGLARAVHLPQLDGNGNVVTRDVNVNNIASLQWQTNMYTRSFQDLNGDGVSQKSEPGLALVATHIRFRDGRYSNLNNTDLGGFAPFNETFPLFNWYVVEGDTIRYKQTGVHVVYDAGGGVDGTNVHDTGGNPLSGNSNIAKGFGNTREAVHFASSSLQFPGSVYCTDADCTGFSIANPPGTSSSTPSTGRIDPPWVTTEGWQGFSGQNSFIEFGKAPYNAGENGGIRGEVVYASTRPYDDPTLNIHTIWSPNVPNVTVNLYQESTAPDGTQTLKMVDTTVSSSWDAWAQGFRSDGVPNMNCPGQDPTDPFSFVLNGTDHYLSPGVALPNNSQFKCYDGMHMFNQVQPAPYDGMYQFPSVVTRHPVTGTVTKTNCKICLNDNTTGQVKGDGNPMLPAGKYVVEIVVPPGYELYKEEDKNILIGDNFIAPVTQQFGGFGNIFILPDQAAVGSANNPYNPYNPTTNLGANPRHSLDVGAVVEEFWPCVGDVRVVPDYISLFPDTKQVSPFAGASRSLCDRKEVTLDDQTADKANFYVFSSTHVAAHYTGFILDDFSAEFDPYSPQFGEKFAVPNLPVSFKDWTGTEISRVYSDQWGQYNGLTYSTWEVNPPNPTGYAPTMMVTCMNDPGPIPGPGGTMIQDPYYNPAYSQFCYENPFMPASTQYMDTPVVPVSAFADGYNPPDCAYPDATPSIASVTGDSVGGGSGPWVSAVGSTLTIKALGDQLVLNPAYTGPIAINPPFNQKFITRHYGFGTGTGTVMIGGISATLVGAWGDTLQVTVPNGIGACEMPQVGQSATQCGELVITTANGQKSIDTVTVTVGGKPPAVFVNGENSSNNALQTALDNATAGDLILVGPGTYNEMLLMWKPVRLQGIGAASVTINANTHPAGRLDPWRRQVDCLFGIALDGNFIGGKNPYDPNGTYSCAFGGLAQVDPIPLEPLIGWDANLNGNLAGMLQEPTLMGAYEGAGITVLAKGLLNANTPGVCDALNSANCVPLTPANCSTDPNSTDPNARSNFLCNPSRIDGISFTNSSQGGGGILIHGWAHNLQVANNRVHGNSGTLTGGITVGQVEVPPANISTVDNVTELPFGYNQFVNVHHNAVTLNASYGDEINSTTPSSAGGVTFCTGADNYKFQYNFVCGNLSSGDGGGISHFGFSYNGDIEHNWILFNQSQNPTLPTYGGGLIAQGIPEDGNFCENSLVDTDCAPSLADGIGPNLTINANLFQGNMAESGKGGGLRLQLVNGSDVGRSPTNPSAWYHVNVTNNIIVNNVAGWGGAGVSMQDALSVNFVNNTVVHNDSTSTAGVLFNTDLAALANVGPPNCTTVGAQTTCQPTTTSVPLPAGLEVAFNTQNLIGVQGAGVNCTITPLQSACFSNPVMANNLFWQNRSFYITVGSLNANIPGLQNVVVLNPTLNQKGQPTGYCDPGNAQGGLVHYWDIGAFGDMAPNSHDSGLTLNPQYSILTDANDYPTGNNKGGDPKVVAQFCNGSRIPPEAGGLGFDVPPGIADTVLPNPLFALLPAAVPDEGNNWINMSFGPLSLVNPAVYPATGTLLGNYAPDIGSPAIDAISPNSPTYALAPATDFYGNARPDVIGTQIDIGAVELTGAGSASALASVTPKSLAFGNVPYGSNSPMSVTLSNAGDGGTVNVGAVTVAGSTDFAVTNSSCTTGLAVGATCSITVTFKPTTVVAENATLNIPTDDPTNPTLAVTVTGTGTPVPLVITASSTTVAYGTAIPVITPSAFAGFVNGDTSASLTTQPTCSTTYKPTSTVSGSPYASSCSGAVDPNYIISYQPGSVTVTRAALTITASSLGMPYGGPLPAIQPIFVGFANGETEAVLTTQPTCSTTATAASTVSGNPYPTSCSGAASANYTISYVAGTLNVTPLTASVTPKPASKVYGTADPSPLTTGTLTGFRLADGVTATYTRTLGETAATYTISATLAPPAVLGNYAITYNTAAFTINKAFTLTKITAHAPNPSNTNQAITVAANVSPQITNTPTGTVTFTASSGESCVGTLTSGAASCSLTLHTAGTLKLAAAYSGDGNFTSSASASVNHTVTGTGVLTVNPTSFNFPDTLLGSGSLSSVIALTNSGTAPVTTLSYRFTDSAYVTGGGTTCGAVLNPAATCNIVVRFRPTTLGAHPATMNINAGGVSKATVSLIGNGVQPAVQLSTTSLQFGGVLSGQTSMLPVTLTNSGTGTLTILNITPGPTSLGAFVSSNNCPAGGLGVGLSCTINVTFKASGAKTPRTGTLSIADNAPGSPHKVSLSGTVQ